MDRCDRFYGFDLDYDLSIDYHVGTETYLEPDLFPDNRHRLLGYNG